MEGAHVRIIIGITQDPKRIQTLVATYQGRRETLTEMGPFISKEEAGNWLGFLKSKISAIEEISPEHVITSYSIHYTKLYDV